MLNLRIEKEFLERQRLKLTEMHREHCPWRTNPCDRMFILSTRVSYSITLDAASIYRVPLKFPVNMAKEVKSRALELESLLSDIEIRHPLVSFSYIGYLSD